MAQSLVEARESVQGDRSVGWGLAAEDSDHDDDLVDVAEQVFRIEALIEAQLAAIDPARVLEVRYDDLCIDPGGVLQRVADWLDLEPRRLEGLEPFKSTDQIRLKPDEFSRLEREIRRRFPSD